jgi:asparagine synthase (glutamine-hydrolysing)
MCGICGILNIDNKLEISDNNIISMRDTMVSRGPDDSGIYITPDRKLGLGHRRLSILDLSPNGKQPMTNEDGSIFLVFNGEIYNFSELREELTNQGHIFKSKTDSEVILHLYEKKGKDCVNYIQGMFAFAIWDSKQNTLLLARDPLGKKPLVYSYSKGRFYFASEIKAILSSSDVEQEIDPYAILQYFAYIYVPYPNTIFNAIKKIPPSCVMIIKDGTITLERYKFFDYGTKAIMSEDSYCKKFLDLFENSVKTRLISDVPLGAMLSGGIDSSSIVAVMREYSSNPIHTFSLGYQTRGKKDTDFIYARVIAEKFGTHHKEILVTPDILKFLPEIVQSFDEPNSQVAIIYNFFFLSEIKKDVTVVLSGDGGDEIFGGYPGYTTIKQADFLWSVSRIFPWHLLKKLSDKIIKNSKKKSCFQNTVSDIIELLNLPMCDVRATIKIRSAQTLFKNLFNQQFLKSIKNNDIGKEYSKMFHESHSKNFVDSSLYGDLLLFNQHGIVIMNDVCGMANSLEVRAPYLDDKIIDFAASLPVNQKIKSIFFTRYNKFIIKKSMAGILPKEIISREKKGYGYSIPINDWCKNEWKDYIQNMIFNGSLSKTGIFNMIFINKIWGEYLSGKKNHLQLIWSLLIFEVWFQLYIEKSPADLIRYHYK